MRRRSPRLPFLALLAGALCGVVVLSEPELPPAAQQTRAVSARGPVPSAPPTPAVPGPGAAATTFFCAAGTGAPGGAADHTVVVVNPADAPVTAVVTVHGGSDAAAPAGRPDAGSPRVRRVRVPPSGRAALRLGDVVAAPYVAAVVEVDGSATVEHEVAGPHGRSAGPCATRAAEEWHLAWGATTRGARQVLVVFNPFPSPASVDAVFRVESGGREPDAFQGVPVPPGGVVALDVGTAVRREADVTATVRTRRGRVVVERLQWFDGSDGPAGLAVALGTPEPATAWAFAAGAVRPAGAPTIVVHNPGERRAEVEVTVHPDAGPDASPDPGASPPVAPRPFGLSIAPGQRHLLRLGDESRVPHGVELAATVVARNGVPVVVERVLRTAGETADDPGGLTVASGAPLASDTWWFAALPEPATVAVAVHNPDPATPVRVRIRALDPGGSIGSVVSEVPAGGRRTVEVGPDVRAPGAAIVLAADGPVIGERVLSTGSTVHVLAPGVPVGDRSVPLVTG